MPLQVQVPVPVFLLVPAPAPAAVRVRSPISVYARKAPTCDVTGNSIEDQRSRIRRGNFLSSNRFVL